MAIKQITDYQITPGDYTYYEGSDAPGAGWTFNEEAGTYVKPNFQAPSKFTLEDIKNRSSYAFDQNQDKLVSDGANELLDPNAYYNQLSSDLVDMAFNKSAINDDASEFNTLIEGLKDVNPQAYYKAKIDYLSRQAGQNYMANESGRMETYQKQLQDLLPAAQQAGLTTEQINNTYGSGFSTGGQTMQQIIANQHEQGGNLKPLVEGIKFIGPALLGMYGIDAALTAGLGAGYGAATGMSTVGLGSGAGGAAALEGGALAAGAGAGGFGGAGAVGSYITPELMGPTYGELGVTGVEGGFAGPTYGEMGYTGLNQAEAIAAADAASKGMSLSDVYKTYNRAKQVANLLSKKGTTGQTSGSNSALAGALTQLPQEQFGGLYRMNEKPFLNFQQQQSSISSPKAFDFLKELSQEGTQQKNQNLSTNQLLANLLYSKA